MKANIVRITINTLLGLILIIFWLKVVDVSEVFEKISRVDFKSLFLFPVCFIAANLFRSIRLKILLSAFQPKLINLSLITYLSQLLSFTIPLRVGEVGKAAYLSTNLEIPFPRAVVWVFLDRFLDFWLFLGLALIFLTFIPTNIPASLVTGLGAIIAFITFITVLTILFPNFVKKIFYLFSFLLIFNFVKKYFIQILEFIIDSTALLRRSFLELLGIFITTILAISTDALSWYVVFKAVFGSIGLFEVYLGFLLSGLTYLIPAAPGYVGSAEASGLAVFGFILGFDQTLSSASIVLMHGLTFVCILLFGLLSLYFLDFKLSFIWQKFKKTQS